MKSDWEHLKHIALQTIEATLAELPEPLQQQAEALPVTFEMVPNVELQADGIKADTLGLFTGADFTDADTTVLPPQIILFLKNVWDFSENDEEIFRTEIRITFLHEMGHFFGLDENDLADRSLD